MVLIRPQKTESPFVPTITTPVLLTLVPINKGDLLDANFLKQIEVQRKDLTPKQRLEILTAEQVIKFESYKIKAKKNLPPHRILFWSDLDFISPKQLGKSNPPLQIIYSDSKDKI